jgi:hypothetical protein
MSDPNKNTNQKRSTTRTAEVKAGAVRGPGRTLGSRLGS